jgi:hypothetical protein
MAKEFNRRGNSLVTNAPPTGRTTEASGGFDMVDGIPVPEDRSVRRFDGAEFSNNFGSRFSTSIGGFSTGLGGERYTGDASISAPNSLGDAYNTLMNMYGGDASTSTLNQATQSDYLLGLTQGQQNAGAAIGGTTPAVSQGQVQSLVDIIRAAGGNVVEGVADLGNLIFQAVTLGQGPRLEAVIPNLMDIINGGIGGTLVLGGGSNPVTVLGTGQTGIGAGTRVGIPQIPVIGPLIQGAIDIFNQGGTLADILQSIPSNVYNNLPEILAGAAAAGLLFDEKDKETLVGLGIEPSILGGTDNVLGGTDNVLGGTDLKDIVAGGVGSDSSAIKTGGVGSDSSAIKTGGVGSDSSAIKTGGVGSDSSAIKTGGVGSDSSAIKTGGVGSDSSAIKTGGVGSDSSAIKTGGVGSDSSAIKTGGVGSDSSAIKTGGVGSDSSAIKTGGVGSDSSAIKTGGVGSDSSAIKTGTMSDAELDVVLTDLGGLPAVKGGYDTPSGAIKTGGASSSSSGGSTTQSAPSPMGSQVTSPGDLVDIQYLYDVFGDSIFAPTIDDTELKEGGIVNNYNSMDEIMKLLNGGANNFAEGGLAETESEASTVIPRRAGEYGRRYFTDPTYTATGLDVAGDALATGADAVNIPGYTFNRQLRADPNTPYVPSVTAGTGALTSGAGTDIFADTASEIIAGGTDTLTSGAGTDIFADTASEIIAGGTDTLTSGAGTDIFADTASEIIAGGTDTLTSGATTDTTTDTTTDIIATPAATTGAATGTTFPEGTDGNGVVSNSVLNGFGEVVNGADTSTGQLTSAQLKQAVLDGSMDYNAAYKALGVADAVNPFGFTDTEQMALGIHESQRTGQGYKYNSTTGSTDLYDYDAGEWVDNTVVDDTVVDDTVVDETDAAFNTFISSFYNQSALTPAQLIQLGDSGYDLSTIASTLDVDLTTLTNAITQARTTTAVDETDAAFNTFISPFRNQAQLTPAQLIQLGGSNFDLATIASDLDVDPTALSNAIAQATSAAQTQSIFDAVDPADGFSDTEAASIANLILGGQIDIEGVANQFEGVSDMDVIEGMLRGGYETPAAMTERLTPANTGFTEVKLMGILLGQGRTTPEELAAYYGNNPNYPDFAGVTAAEVRAFAKELGIEGYAAGGSVNGYYLGGTTDGMADQVPATIDNNEPARLSHGEFVIPADAVAHFGNGNSEAGADFLTNVLSNIREDRTGNPNQGRQIDPNQYLV